MRLNVEISDETYEKLKKQARKAGVTIEAVAGKQLAQVLSKGSATSAPVKDRWSKDGRPWDQLSLVEIKDCYREAYTKKTVDADEFTWHDDDVAMFGDRD